MGGLRWFCSEIEFGIEAGFPVSALSILGFVETRVIGVIFKFTFVFFHFK